MVKVLAPLLLLTLCLLPGQERGEGPRVRILIVYHSGEGHTALMAEAVARGARSVEGAEVSLRKVQEASPEEVLPADAIILGSPVYNANVAPPVQEFINRWPFRGAPLRDKLGAAFACGGGLSAGEELTQLSLLHSMLVFGMIVVGGPTWREAFGASAVVSEGPFRPPPAQGEPPSEAQPKRPAVDELFLKKGEALGKRVAELARKLKR